MKRRVSPLSNAPLGPAFPRGGVARPRVGCGRVIDWGPSRSARGLGAEPRSGRSGTPARGGTP
jgi:hypothetical protein